MWRRTLCLRPRRKKRGDTLKRGAKTMTKRTGLLIAAAAVALPLAGCTLRSVSFHVQADHPRPHRVHIHSRFCGHYHDGDHWVSITHGHAHGPGCGHYYGDHGWVRTGRTFRVAPTLRHRVTHFDDCRHHRGCPHVYSGTAWITISTGHHHGPDCGHRFHGGRWEVHRSSRVNLHRGRGKVRVGHTHHARCGCVWNHNRWMVLGGHHVHGPRCGHVRISGRWSIR